MQQRASRRNPQAAETNTAEAQVAQDADGICCEVLSQGGPDCRSKLADNFCFVDVSCTQTGASNVYSIGDGTYRVYLMNTGNGYKIVQFAGVE